MTSKSIQKKKKTSREAMNDDFKSLFALHTGYSEELHIRISFAYIN